MVSAGVQIGAIVGIEVLKFIAQVYATAAKQYGISEETARQNFDKTFPVFMAASEKPVEEVKP